MVVDNSKSHLLKPIIQGQDNLIQRTQWKCEVLDSTEVCPRLDEIDDEPIIATKFLPQNYFRTGPVLRFTMSLETAGEAAKTGFDTIS